jgi:Bacterial Ig-like domain (group 3)
MGTLDGSGAATMNTTTLPAGADIVTAVYAAAGNFAASTSAAVTVTVSAPPVASAGSYTVSASPTSLTVQQGSAANTMLTFTPTGGYSDTLSLSCSGLPANASCVFAQNQVSLTGNNQSVNVGLSIQTTTQNADQQTPSNAPLPTALLALAFWWPGSLTGIAVLLGKRKRGLCGQICLPLLCTLACAAALSGCGGGGNSYQPPAASPVATQVTVVATGTAAKAVPQTLALTLTITQ